MLGFSVQAPRRSRGAMQAAMDVDDVLVLILERVDSPVRLIRAAATCKRWRRLIADAGFLRRWRSLHGPTVAGDYYNRNRVHDGVDSPSFVPSSSIDARHFSLDFVVELSIFESRSWESYLSWNVVDSRGSLLLMECIHEPHLIYCAFPDLVVCEPLTQRYRIIPRLPGFNAKDCMYPSTYLVDGDEDEARGRIGMSNFRVLFMFLCCEDEVVAHTAMFTVGRGDADSTWSEKVIDHIALKLADPNVTSCYLGCALGSSYHYVQQDKTLITRDGSTGKFSSSDLSLDIKRCWDGHNLRQNFDVVDGGDGEPHIVTVMDNTLEVFARVDGQWGLKNKVLLSKVTGGLPGYRPSLFYKPLTIMRSGVGFITISPWDPNQQWSFSVDLKTMEVASATKGVGRERMTYPCEFPWPPVFQVCIDR